METQKFNKITTFIDVIMLSLVTWFDDIISTHIHKKVIQLKIQSPKRTTNFNFTFKNNAKKC